MYETIASVMNNTAVVVLAQTETGGGPQGAEFGKAAPTGAFIVVFFMAIVIALGLNLNKRIKHINHRRAIAEEKGLDFFDPETHRIATARSESHRRGEDYRKNPELSERTGAESEK